jgi:polyisoprenoid-binding protein YceI
VSTRTATLVPAGTWEVDPAHSSVEFSVKHMGIANVRGRFTQFEGAVEIGDTVSSSTAHGSVTLASIDTNDEQRDGHLRSADFLDVESFPEITFESSRVEPIDDDSTRVFGNLTMHGIRVR